ncbi:ABC-2 type transport system ATP-binding protein [Melghirimyces profundicolus]|uniref:ABC-2 type transport system ATP-binding protein n=1 Tax=Melghirimyces profundicolus TaxID=1242148 RepID=A0A2T6BGX4_9BACL|nr:ABC transporter ATP-binding protein [Melghirimyces profundicolus]PTX55315.1 ABC-2 type transport system ATP-binding protein [Melghirimyces profundicolus]
MTVEANPPVLRVEGLSKRIGKRMIVRDLDFEVKQGEIYGFLGPNGAGKTTTIRMLVGLIQPTEGTIRIAGHDLEREPLKALQHVGCIVENPELYPYLTGRENLELFARMTGDVSPKRIDEVVRLVELGHRIDDKVKTYSLGMKQRLGIAQALLGRPRLLILDEPTNGLDPAGIREMRHFIHGLARDEGISVFISSHILHEVQMLCDRVAIISKGRIIRTGAVSRLLEGDPPVEWEFSPLEQGVDLLRSLSYITALERLSEGRVLTRIPEDRIGEANQILAEAGIRVNTIRRKTPTLEDIFLQMTEGDSIA